MKVQIILYFGLISLCICQAKKKNNIECREWQSWSPCTNCLRNRSRICVQTSPASAKKPGTSTTFIEYGSQSCCTRAKDVPETLTSVFEGRRSCHVCQGDYCLYSQGCLSNQHSCQTTVDFTKETGILYMMTCADTANCQRLSEMNSQLCDGKQLSPRCVYCCSEDNCNSKIPQNPLNQAIDVNANLNVTTLALYTYENGEPDRDFLRKFSNLFFKSLHFQNYLYNDTEMHYCKMKSSLDTVIHFEKYPSNKTVIVRFHTHFSFDTQWYLVQHEIDKCIEHVQLLSNMSRILEVCNNNSFLKCPDTLTNIDGNTTMLYVNANDPSRPFDPPTPLRPVWECSDPNLKFNTTTKSCDYIPVTTTTTIGDDNFLLTYTSKKELPLHQASSTPLQFHYTVDLKRSFFCSDASERTTRKESSDQEDDKECQVFLRFSVVNENRTDSRMGCKDVPFAMIMCPRDLTDCLFPINNGKNTGSLQLKPTLTGLMHYIAPTPSFLLHAHIVVERANQAAQYIRKPGPLAVKFNIIESQTKMCQSINDPHITTFDGAIYDNFYEGEFIMYKHFSKPFAVHAVFQKCSQVINASCNCGVAIRSGDDVIVIDKCRRPPKRYHRWDGKSVKTSGIVNLKITLYLTGELTAGTRIVQIDEGELLIVYLPNGAYVKVLGVDDLVNLWVISSPTDGPQHQTPSIDGFCGNNDNDKDNDLPQRSVTPMYVSTKNPGSAEISESKIAAVPSSVENSSLEYHEDYEITPAHQSRVDLLVAKYRVNMLGVKSLYNATEAIVNGGLESPLSDHLYCECPLKGDHSCFCRDHESSLCNVRISATEDITSSLISRSYRHRDLLHYAKTVMSRGRRSLTNIDDRDRSIYTKPQSSDQHSRRMNRVDYIKLLRDTNIRPSPDVDPNFVPIVPKDWKHNKHWTAEKAQVACRNSYKTIEGCGNIVTRQQKEMAAQSCVKDIQITDSDHFLASSNAAVVQQCVFNVTTKTYQPHGEPRLPVCVKSCGNGGTCLNGKCKCTSNFTMAFCTTDLRLPPAIVPATHVVLNTRMQHTPAVHLSVENVTPDVDCLYQEIKLYENRQYETQTAIIQRPSLHTTSYEVTCSFADLPLNTSYLLQIRNSNEKLSHDKVIVYVFDDRCMECDYELKKCKKKKDSSCVIDGNCYAAYDHPYTGDTKCLQCLPKNSYSNFIKVVLPGCTFGFPLYIFIILSILIGLVVGSVIGLLIYRQFFRVKEKPVSDDISFDGNMLNRTLNSNNHLAQCYENRTVDMDYFNNMRTTTGTDVTNYF